MTKRRIYKKHKLLGMHRIERAKREKMLRKYKRIQIQAFAFPWKYISTPMKKPNGKFNKKPYHKIIKPPKQDPQFKMSGLQYD